MDFDLSHENKGIEGMQYVDAGDKGEPSVLIVGLYNHMLHWHWMWGFRMTHPRSNKSSSALLVLHANQKRASQSDLAACIQDIFCWRCARATTAQAGAGGGTGGMAAFWWLSCTATSAALASVEKRSTTTTQTAGGQTLQRSGWQSPVLQGSAMTWGPLRALPCWVQARAWCHTEHI